MWLAACDVLSGHHSEPLFTSHSMTGLAFWVAAAVSVCVCCISMACKKGDGHEIWLDRDEE
jgi:hypothetical protein